MMNLLEPECDTCLSLTEDLSADGCQLGSQICCTTHSGEAAMHVLPTMILCLDMMASGYTWNAKYRSDNCRSRHKCL